jgi:hypothetical protein
MAGAMQSGGGGSDDNDPVALRGLGPVWRRRYEPNSGKHGTVSRGRVSREPKNGQDALDYSVVAKPTSRMRVGVDYDDGAYVVFHWHDCGEFRDSLNFEIFHGYVLEWGDLTQDQRNALLRWGFANLKGRIQ